MEIQFIRSSLVGSWEICEHAAFLDYILGFKQKVNAKTIKGSCFHSVMEFLSLMKMAADRQEKVVKIGWAGEIEVDLENNQLVDRIINRSFDHYDAEYQDFNYTDKDRQEIREWVYNTISLQNGLFDPRRRDVVGAEMYFDFPINEDWAKLDDGSGEFLRIKGTIDLITKISDNTYEIIDWKSGSRKDWKNDKEKDYAYLCKDFQLLLYYYAITRLYPDIKNVIITINYVRDGGPFTIPYSAKDKELALSTIKQKYLQIKNCLRPKLKSSGRTHWWCQKVCWAGPKSHHPKDPTKSICQYIHDDLVKNGLEFTINNERAEGFNSSEYKNT